MKIILIKSEGEIYKALVDDEDYEYLNKFKWFLSSVKRGNTAYAVRRYTEDGKRHMLLMHREILSLNKGEKTVDHIDGNGLNNQKSNLRFCNNSQNQMNRKKGERNKQGRTSKYKGVSWFKRDSKWRVQITVDGVCKHIGMFFNEIEAAKAYDKLALKNFGEFARLNFPHLREEYEVEIS